MTFQDYQKLSRQTAVYPDAGKNYIYPALGLAGEAGEAAQIVKRIIRDKGGLVDEETKTALVKELGDVLWYIAQLATEFGLDFDKIAQDNIEKLRSRKERGTLHGQGGNR